MNVRSKIIGQCVVLLDTIFQVVAESCYIVRDVFRHSDSIGRMNRDASIIGFVNRGIFEVATGAVVSKDMEMNC